MHHKMEKNQHIYSCINRFSRTKKKEQINASKYQQPKWVYANSEKSFICFACAQHMKCGFSGNHTIDRQKEKKTIYGNIFFLHSLECISSMGMSNFNLNIFFESKPKSYLFPFLTLKALNLKDPVRAKSMNRRINGKRLIL